MSHARLSPSSASRWVACPGSIALCESVPREEGDQEAARIGSAAHWVAERWLGGAEPVIGQETPQGVIVDADMVDAVEIYVDHVRDTSEFAELHLEERVNCPEIHMDCWGTPDCWTVQDGTVYLWDYKHGREPVDVWENWQLLVYAAGLLRYVPYVDRATLTIVQPRAFHRDGPVRSWTATVDDLVPYWTQARISASTALGNAPTCHAGLQCRRCPGRLYCEANAAVTGADCDYAGTTTPGEVTPEQAALEWVFLSRAAKRIQARLDACEAIISHAALEGRRLPHVDVYRGQGRLAWSRSRDEVLALGEIYGLPLTKPADLITPKQAEKLGIDQSILSSFTHRPETGLKIKEASNREARLVFGGKSCNS